MPTVTLETGQKLTFPAGTTPDQIHFAVDEFVTKNGIAKQEAAPQAPEAPQQPIQPTQEPQSFQEQVKPYRRSSASDAKTMISAIYSGAEDLGTGIYQAAADLGFDFSGAKKVLSMVRPDLREQIQSLTPEDISQVLADKQKAKNAVEADKPLGFKVIKEATKIVPFLTAGSTTGKLVSKGLATGGKVAQTLAPIVGLATGGAVGGAETSALSPQEQAGLGNRAVETAKGAAIGAVAAPIIGKTTNVITNAPNIAKELVKKLVGIDPVKVAKFADAGLDPTLANISKYRPVSQIQNFLSATPGASARIDRVIQHQIDNVANKSAAIAGSKGGTIEQAGNIIGAGAKTYKKTLGDRANAIYEDVYNKVPKNTKINLQNTNDLINNDLSLQEIAATSDFIKRKIERFNQITSPEIFGDAANSLSRIKVFRSSIGKDSSSHTLTGNERGALKKIYGALSGDLKEGVLTAARNNFGENEAVRIYGKFNAADNLYKLQQDYIKKTITPLEKAKTPDKIYSIATSGIKNGGVQIENVFRALNEDQKAFVRGSLINKMGKAAQSVQDETGNLFSLSKFRQDFNALSDEAKKAIFTPKQVSEYQKLIKASSEIERTGRLGKINSFTAQTIGWGGLTGAVISPYLSLPAAAGIVGGARITAGMMTNPRFVNWLSQQAKVDGPKAIENSIGRLGAIAIASDDSTKEDILQYMSNLSLISDIKAEDASNLTEEEIRAQLIDVNHQNKKKKLPPAYSEEEIKNNPSLIKKRYYR